MKLENIESVYPLSPMQDSMLFYAQTRVTAKQAHIKNSDLTRDVLFNQTQVEITGNIQLSEFKQAWQQIVNDNGAFRTGFLWEGLKQAQQFVRKQIELPFQFTDLILLEEQEKAQALIKLERNDFEEGFELTKAPLMRILLIRLSTNKYRLIWSSHHLIIDRWCIPIVFEKFVQYYDALIQNEQLPNINSPPFKRYIGWRLKQPFDKIEQYWQTNLAGLTQSSKLCERNTNAPSMKFDHFLGADLMDGVKRFCRSHKITLASVFQSAWGLTLNRLLVQQDIVYGLVVSGRPAQVKDVESILGSFVNNVPVRLSLNKDLNVIQWLKQNQSQSFQRMEFEHESIVKLHGFTRLPIDEPLFDHVLVWQNDAQLASSQFLKLSPVPGKLITAYPLTLSIEEKDQGLHLAAMVQSGWVFTYKDALFKVLESVLSELSAISGDQNLGDLTEFQHSKGYQAEQHEQVQPLILTKLTTGKLLDKVITGRTYLTKDVVEEFLIQEWLYILELDEVGLDDDFFALGGTSLKAAQVVARLEQAERKHIPIIQLFAGRTIRTMTQIYLDSDWSLKSDWAIPVNTKGKGTPIFYIASPEVNTIGYAHLVREVGPEISAYVLQPPPTSKHVRQVRTHEMPALSLEFIKEIRRIQPHGPYRIVGMCSGAHIGAEILRQMQKQSIEVSFFAVINTWSLYSISKLYHCEKLVDVYRTSRYYSKRACTIKFSEIKNRLLPALNRKLFPKSVRQQTEPSPDQETFAPMRQYDETVTPIQEEKWASERPTTAVKIKLPVTIFRIKSKPYWRIRSHALGWEYLAHNVKVIHLKEQVHELILREPNVGHFAKQLRAEILALDKQLKAAD